MTQDDTLDPLRKKQLVDGLMGDAPDPQAGALNVPGIQPSAGGPTLDPPALPGDDRIQPPGGPVSLQTTTPNWRDNSTVNLPGWDNTRTDNSGKYEFGRFAQSKGGHLTGDDVRGFVNQNPDEWEIYGGSSKDDPLIRQKQAWLSDPSHGDSKSGQQSTWQDVIRDAGPGGANQATFNNAAGDPSLGFAAPEEQAQMPQGGGLLPGTSQGQGGGTDVLAQIMAALAKYQQPGGQPPTDPRQSLLAGLMGGK